MNHDIITIGASAGAFDVLLDLAAGLPKDLPASVFVVMHIPPDVDSTLPELLTHRAGLPAVHPLHHEAIKPGHIYVAPPDNHILVRPGSMEVVRGARENGHRPAVDALFRSASAAYGPRVVGVVLSGYQDCGTAGMLSIKARGGLSVVQSPETAAVPEMPRSVIASMKVDHVVDAKELPALLTRLAHSPAGPQLTPGHVAEQLEGALPGERAELVCPICHGVLNETAAGVFHHFRCHVGHTFSLSVLARAQSEETERALWASARALEESASLSERLARTGNGEIRRRYVEKATTLKRHAEHIREILLETPTTDVPHSSE